MEKIVWLPEYDTGIEAVDRQHKHLVSLINRLEDINSSGYVLEELGLYVKEHFRLEEQLLREAKYPDFDAHKKQHRSFEEWLSAVRQAFNASGSTSHLMTESVRLYLQSWLLNHILKSDKDYVAFVKP
ncbi:MAG: hemerythrin family protein [Methylocystaceae bacterium]|nr:hemerythrin family protein [Methylocystaceae bacterium]